MAETVAFLILVAFTVAIEHMAFGRHPAWKGREMARRAIGIGTVLALALIPVGLGSLDGMTWAVILAGFLLAGAVMAVMSYREKGQLREVRRDINERGQRWEKEG